MKLNIKPAIIGVTLCVVWIGFVITWRGCEKPDFAPTSRSVAQAKERNIFLAEYDVTTELRFESCEVLEAWIERSRYENYLVISLRAPQDYHDPKIIVRSQDAEIEYRGYWYPSNEQDQVYEMWAVPEETWVSLIFVGGDESVEIKLKGGVAEQVAGPND